MNHLLHAARRSILAGAAGLFLSSAAHAGTVGYFKNCSIDGDAAPSIEAAGHVVRSISTLDAVSLQGLQGLVIQTCYQPLGNAAVNVAVQNGLHVLIDDGFNYSSWNAAALPGSPNLTAVLALAQDFQFPPGSPAAIGPGGALDDGSLDWPFLSASAIAVQTALLPANVTPLLNAQNAGQTLTFSYPVGRGRVTYSAADTSIGLPDSYYTGVFGCPAFNCTNARSFLTNLIAWTIPPFTSCAAEGFAGAKRTLCHQICEVSHPAATLSGLIRAWKTVYRIDPPCAN